MALSSSLQVIRLNKDQDSRHHQSMKELFASISIDDIDKAATEASQKE